MNLPQFRYHPDPVGSGSIVTSIDVCKCCGQARGYIYKASVYSTHEIEDAICPWCIADGSANRKFKATFVDTEAFDEGVSKATQNEISQRTSGFASWQTEQWPACCGNATGFLTPTGLAEIRKSNYEWEGFLYDHGCTAWASREARRDG